MPGSETIIACATGSTPSPRALIRASGPACKDLLTQLEGHAPLARYFAPVRLRLSRSHTLPALRAFSPGPASFTGEDTFELVVPGSPALVDRLIGRMIELVPHVRRAHAGEFSARAYHHGKLTLAQAEGLAAVIAAAGQHELDSARRVLSGEAGESYRRWSQELAHLLALVEAGIDFSDQEDVVAIAPRDLLARARALSDALGAHLGATLGSAHVSAHVRIVLAGSPNAGKSTLFNALLARPRALVSDQPGTTRDVLREPITLIAPPGRSIECELCDVAGLSDRPRDLFDEQGQARALRELQQSDIVVHCDPSGAFAPLPLAPDVECVRVRTKCDLAADSTSESHINLCALDGFGLDHLRHALFERAWAIGRGRSGLDLLPRHRAALEQTHHHLAHLIDSLTLDPRALTTSPELIAATLREALDALGELTGRVERDEIIGRVFASFCIGK